MPAPLTPTDPKTEPDPDGHHPDQNGAESAVLNADLLSELREDAAGPAACRAEEAAAVVRQAWREAEEFNLNASLFLEALFVQLRRAFV